MPEIRSPSDGNKPEETQMNRAVAVTRRQRQARPCRRGSAHRGGMDRGQLRPRTLTGQPSSVHTHQPHRLRPGRRGTLRHRRGAQRRQCRRPSGRHSGRDLRAQRHDLRQQPGVHLPRFQAAKLFHIHNLVWACSETLLGYPFNNPPAYVPLDERTSRPPPRSCTP